MKNKSLTILVIILLCLNFSFTNKNQINIGDQAPNFTLLGSDGKQHQLSDYKGKVVLLDFWAMWCAPCRKKMPKLQLLKNSYKHLEVISVLAMNKGAEKKAKAYFKKKNFTIPLLFGNTKIIKSYNLKFLPTVVMIDKNGKIIYLTTTPNKNEIADVVTLYKKHN